MARGELGGGQAEPTGRRLLHGALATPPGVQRVIYGAEHGCRRGDGDPAGLLALSRACRRAPVRPAWVHGRRSAARRGAESHDHALALRPVDLGCRESVVDTPFGKVFSLGRREQPGFQAEWRDSPLMIVP